MSLSSLLGLVCIVAAFGYAFALEAPVGRFSGQVLHTKTQQPIAGARVILIADGEQEDDARWYRGRSDEEGEFRIASVPAGSYQAAAYAPGLTGQPVAITIGEGTTRLALTLQRPPSLRAESIRAQPSRAPHQSASAPRQPLYARVPPSQPVRDPVAVRIRTLDIVRARYNLSRELYHIIRANNRSGLPLEIVLAQAGAESSFRPWLAGDVGEIGLFQLKSVTANDQGLGKYKASQVLDPALNTRLATTYMGTLVRQFGNVRTALAAYNQGPGNTMRSGLRPKAQIYADGILRAAWHKRFQTRLRAIDPGFGTARRDVKNHRAQLAGQKQPR